MKTCAMNKSLMMVFARKEGEDGTWWLEDLRYVL
jgi:hypothetical protein